MQYRIAHRPGNPLWQATLYTFGVLLKKAVEWNVIDRTPCTIRLLTVSKASVAFHDFDDYEKLLHAAARIDQNTYVLVLLGGDAGLRLGEMMALEWGTQTGRGMSRQRREDDCDTCP